MNQSSFSGGDRSFDRDLETACEELEKASQRFDGHKQLPVSVAGKAPWEDPVGFDPDEIEHEKTLESHSSGREFKNIDQVTESDCAPGACVCGSCPDPRTSLEMAEEEAFIQKIIDVWAREGVTEGLVLFINHIAEEYGPAFRQRLIVAGVII